MLPLLTPVVPLICDALNPGADYPFPRFACVITELQAAILKNPKLLVYYLGVCQHNLDVTASSATKALLIRIVAFFRDTFPTICVKSMPAGHYGHVAIVPAGSIPTISFSRELVVALETANDHDFPMLLVAVVTTALHESSHAAHSYVFGNKNHPPVWHGMDRTRRAGGFWRPKSCEPSSVFISSGMTLQTIRITFEVSTSPVRTMQTSDMCLVSLQAYI